MGGANGGNVASAIAIKVISDRIVDVYRDGMESNSLRNMLDTAIAAANVEIYDTAMADAELRGMGTTVVALILSDSTAHICLLYTSPDPPRTERCAGAGRRALRRNGVHPFPPCLLYTSRCV